MKKPIIINKYYKTAFICLLLLNFSCKSAKNANTSGNASTNASVKQIINQHYANQATFKTLQGKVKINFTKNQKEQGLSFTLRMEKDKAIWLSATLGLARLMITPNKVRFYNKLEKECFDGDYKLLSDVAGIDLDFNKVQNILLGQAVFDLKNKPHLVEVDENIYVLQPKDQSTILELFYKLNPSNFKMNSQQLYQQLKRRFLQIDYLDYQTVSDNTLPKNIKILAVENKDEVIIDLEYKSLTINEAVRFPFKIPSGYKKIDLK